MKSNKNMTRSRLYPVALVGMGLQMCIFALLATVSPVQAATGEYSLMVQRSPVDGGTVTPDAGVHSYNKAEKTTITASPRPGYRFAGWLGDVGNNSSASTTITVDSPKMVVAVFQREDEEETVILTEEQSPQSQASGPLHRNSRGVGAGGGASPAGGGFPIASGDDDPEIIPVDPPETPEIPEPATILLLGAGGLLLRRRPRQK
ncbi:hypothetical protein STSP2_03425 [Anaerohalosphaera lusitana]|uniref:PEP-CTERM protein-sorting domain-containing protein n=1 Tax=Anaerohalosphaera lusitana TaxID=1936003 RepID=A0A1U9NQN2_9BACT|nr:PEP-CTERM sorting domain-containing protein [Anaerohalosphaera lusitana]AQT70219.1 hypothetical protein STSP2_03425 [Anaerohalosphaera lusitana]